MDLKLISAFAVCGLMLLTPLPGVASDSDGQEYAVHKGESLGTISEHFYEDPPAYPSIMDATNKKTEHDDTFKVIPGSNEIETEQKPGIPVLVMLEAEDMEAHGMHKAAHWGYQGEGGPTHWGSMDEKFKVCSSGRNQSPVSIPSTAGVVKDVVTFDYNPTTLHVLNNGHTIQVNYDDGSSITVDGTAYNLAQFHFHSPSENTMDDVAAAMEMHLVHVSTDGKLAVVGLLFDFADSQNDFLSKFWGVMPPAGHELRLSAKLNASDAFDVGGEMYQFDGSLTTPPCSEGVKWFVMKQRASASKDQVAAFVKAVGYNARPTQPLNGRLDHN